MPDARTIFGAEQALIGMIHVPALPGTPLHSLPLEDIVRQATEEACLLHETGVDAVLVENMHDVPYLLRRVGPEIVTGMTAVARSIRHALPACPIGIQVLAGANREALAVALACGGSFIRAEGFQYAAVADEGLLDTADAGPLLRYRRAVGAEAVHVLADVKKKHSSHALTADVDIAETARTATFMGADGVVVTGSGTGDPVDAECLGAVRHATSIPVLVGSGVTPDTAGELLRHADGLIVGSALKHDGHWSNPPDPRRVADMVAAVAEARSRRDDPELERTADSL